MKKSNVILQTAIASALFVMAGSASAGNLTAAGTTFATEVFGPTFTATTGIMPGAITDTLTTTSGIVINAGGVVYYSLRLTNGTFRVAPLAAQLTGTALAVGGAGNGVVGAPVMSTDRTTVTFPITYTLAATLGVGSTLIYTPITTAVDGVNATMAVAGTNITATAALSSVTPAIVAPSLTTAPNTGTPQAADLDGGLTAAATVATSATANVAVVTASSSFPLGYALAAGTSVGQAGVLETAKIDLTATGSTSGPGARFTLPGAGFSSANSITVLNLGAAVMGNTAGAQVKADGTTAYLISNAVTANTFSGTVVGAFKAGSTMALTTDAACASSVATAPAGVLNAANTTFTFTNSTVPGIASIEGASAPSFICLTTPATTGAITTSTPVATFTATPANPTDKAISMTGTLYAMTTNGQTVDVRSYIPAVTVGYQSFVRMINGGAVAATVTGQWLYEDGTVSVAAPLTTLANGGASLAIGGSRTLTSAQVEAALGAPTVIGNNRPRLRLTAPTNVLQAQSFFLTTANGNFSDVTGAQ